MSVTLILMVISLLAKNRLSEYDHYYLIFLRVYTVLQLVGHTFFIAPVTSSAVQMYI